MGHRRRAAAWIRWAVLLGVCSAGFGVVLPGRFLEGERAIAVTPAEITSWRFNTDSQQLEVVLPGGATPRYFLLAQPARIVVDIPAVDAGASAGEQTFSGVVSRVRVAQFEPGLTRIVLELSPDVELAPGQVELNRAETLATGEARWTLRPLLVGMAPAQDTQNDVAINSPGPITPSPADVAPAIAPAVPVEPTLSAVPAIVQPDPAMAIPEGSGATIAVPPPEPDPTMGMAFSEDSRSTLDAPPLEEPAPSPTQANIEAAEAPMDMVTPEDPAIAITESPPDTNPASAPLAVPSNQTVITEPPRLSDESPTLNSQGAEFLSPEAALIPETSTATQGDDEALNSANLPDAVEIPIDFPAPTLSDNEASSSAMPSRVSALPPTDPATDAPAIAVPPLDSIVPVTEPESVAAAPTQPNVLIPAGQTLQLRYPRPSSLELSDRPWQEVLVLANPVEDSQGTVLVPAGTQVIGRFERDGRGYRFIAQAIALNDTVLMIQGASAIFRDESIEPNTVIELDVDRDLMRSPTP
ncbi:MULTISPECIES: AMIN domain-containing protein [unclassified Leptolyngbya]|uniref:AMIN domain-containing protein n=1 Tax=unclassified Leptolyngbya TaxID=2650499 RepID=UPI001687EF32|nr:MULTISPECIES: AMIN domain-containing protein [unclassified Leptolyngbya]MBD1913051.1 AMIN domain-containing protein [Leptolyngbya sp. FACHB-8]MBD2154448.1 AMIN domain-containing protein [Leptolyngbya sp. FACHB-16]